MTLIKPARPVYVGSDTSLIAIFCFPITLIWLTLVGLTKITAITVIWLFTVTWWCIQVTDRIISRLRHNWSTHYR